MSFAEWRLGLATLLLSAFCSGAYATVAVGAPKTLADLPLLVVGGGMALALLGGVSNTLLAVHRSVEDGKPLQGIKVLLALNSSMALIMGAVAYALTEHFQTGANLQLGVLPLCGFIGARFVVPFAEMAATKAVKAGEKALGPSPEKS